MFKEWNSNTYTLYVSLISSANAFGAAIGSLCAIYLNPRFGRRKSMIFSDIFAIIGTGLTLIKSPNVIVVGRTLVGIAIGINSVVVNIYVNEMTPKKISGKMVFFLKQL